MGEEMALYGSFSEWQQASPAQKERAAHALARALPDGFAFDAVRSFDFAGRHADIAQFTLGDACFSLVPGATVRLGFDAADWTPTPDMVESWQDTARTYGIDESLHDHVDARTRERRTVTLGPLLVETRHAEVGWRKIDSCDARVRALLDKHPQGVTQYDGVITRITVSDNGEVVAEQADARALTYAGIVRQDAGSGFRFPTPDEWEYLCGAGAPTLFRWGNHVPCDRYPTDAVPDEAASERETAIEGARAGHPVADFPPRPEIRKRPQCVRPVHRVGSLQGGADDGSRPDVRWRRRLHDLRRGGIHGRLAAARERMERRRLLSACAR
ncbi:hypothetical protein ACRS8P_11370 [Burkholderia cenocepacia]